MDLTILVNKEHLLYKNYVPDDLIEIHETTGKKIELLDVLQNGVLRNIDVRCGLDEFKMDNHKLEFDGIRDFSKIKTVIVVVWIDGEGDSKD